MDITGENTPGSCLPSPVIILMYKLNKNHHHILCTCIYECAKNIILMCFDTNWDSGFIQKITCVLNCKINLIA